MTALSILDLAPINEGGSVAKSLANTVDLARLADDLGYRRYWMAEHHGMVGIASAATAVLIGHVAGATRRIRVGAGGIMLPKDRKSTRLNSSHVAISYAVFCLKNKKAANIDSLNVHIQSPVL